MKLRNEIDEHNWKRYLVSSIEDINDTLLETNRILEAAPAASIIPNRLLVLLVSSLEKLYDRLDDLQDL